MHLVMIGGSDAGISAALRARELDPASDVTVVVADAYPNFSICGIPYYVSGEVAHWRNLAHRTAADLEATGMQLRLDTIARRIDVAGRKLQVSTPRWPGRADRLRQLDRGHRASLSGLPSPVCLDQISRSRRRRAPAAHHGRHLRGHADARDDSSASAVIVGAGYVGLEMAEALTARGLRVTQIEQLPEVLATVDAELGGLVHAELAAHGIEVLTSTTVQQISRATPTSRAAASHSTNQHG